MAERTVYVPQKPKVVINPAILPYIQNYEVEYKLLLEYNEAFEDWRVKRSCPLGKYERIKDGSYPYYSNPVDSLYILGGDEVVIQDVENKLSTLDRQLAFNYLNYPGVPQVNGDIDYEMYAISVVRVSVTIYPKAPYNTDPIVTTRTFRPKFVLDSKYGNGR